MCLGQKLIVRGSQQTDKAQRGKQRVEHCISGGNLAMELKNKWMPLSFHRYAHAKMRFQRESQQVLEMLS